MGLVKSTLGTYALGYILLAAVAAACLLLNLFILRRHTPTPSNGAANELNRPEAALPSAP